MKKAREIEEKSVAEYQFFYKFREISSELKANWNHIDLFFCRNANQKQMEKQIGIKGGKLNPNPFGEAQLALTKELMDLANPCMVLVANAKASEIFKQKFKPIFDEENGFHFIGLGKREKVPVFFSSMLTGQRAIDNHSYERLKWHMKKIWQELH